MYTYRYSMGWTLIGGHVQVQLKTLVNRHARVQHSRHLKDRHVQVQHKPIVDRHTQVQHRFLKTYMHKCSTGFSRQASQKLL